MEKPKIPSPNRLRQNVKRNFQLATLLVLAVDLNGVAMSIKMSSYYPEAVFLVFIVNDINMLTSYGLSLRAKRSNLKRLLRHWHSSQ
jgi:hypothetical protein